MKTQIEYRNCVITIEQDENARNPNPDEPNVFLVYDHRQFTVKQYGFEPERICEYLANKSVNEEDVMYDDYTIFLVFAYIHSGVTLSLSSFNDRFDTSMRGYILVDTRVIKKDKAKEEAECLIKLWNMYLHGEVLRYSIEQKCKYIKIADSDVLGYGDELEFLDAYSELYMTVDEVITLAKSSVDELIDDEPTKILRELLKSGHLDNTKHIKEKVLKYLNELT